MQHSHEFKILCNWNSTANRASRSPPQSEVEGAQRLFDSSGAKFDLADYTVKGNDSMKISYGSGLRGVVAFGCLRSAARADG
jgi:hypothetical protein